MTSPFEGMRGRVLAGFVDIQVNGGFGHDFTADPASIWDVARRLPEYGVTAFLPTVTSGPVTTAVEALRILAAGPPAGWRGARPLGLHVEGPMISPRRRGTHPVDALVPPSLAFVDEMMATGTPRMVTLAPELAGSEAVIRRLVEAGTVVAVGHSDATAAQVRGALDQGISHATHLFNAMSALDHRSPGVVAAVFDDETVTAGLIADGIHIAPEILRLALKELGPGRLALVTDCISAMGMGDGSYRLGAIDVEVVGVEVRNEEGNLAGSAAGYDHVVRTMAAATGCSIDQLVAMTSTTPSRILGTRTPEGDRVLVDDDFNVLATAVDGEVLYRRTPQ